MLKFCIVSALEPCSQKSFPYFLVMTYCYYSYNWGSKYSEKYILFSGICILVSPLTRYLVCCKLMFVWMQNFLWKVASDSGRGPEGMVWQDTANTKMSCPWHICECEGWRKQKSIESKGAHIVKNSLLLLSRNCVHYSIIVICISLILL